MENIFNVLSSDEGLRLMGSLVGGLLITAILVLAWKKLPILVAIFVPGIFILLTWIALNINPLSTIWILFLLFFGFVLGLVYEESSRNEFCEFKVEKEHGDEIKTATGLVDQG